MTAPTNAYTGRPSEQAAVSDGTMPCPVASPAGLPCTKRIPKGWTADEGHGGGHFWASVELQAIFDGGHYNASKALASLPFDGHLPDACRPGCPKWRNP
ncbi:hypothetical protein AB0F17_62000 [Nonomuraea sp. NPDC026600]|uniref:hypothetical protein n=1 Tax=Nonomuraea sp. NPDC026600 TaxID=3155363 RepID=UPI0033F8302A